MPPWPPRIPLVMRSAIRGGCESRESLRSQPSVTEDGTCSDDAEDLLGIPLGSKRCMLVATIGLFFSGFTGFLLWPTSNHTFQRQRLSTGTSMGKRVEILPPNSIIYPAGEPAAGLAAKQASPAKLGTTLYCFAVSLPTGNEPALLRSQYVFGLSIFACDGYVVLSSEQFTIGSSGDGQEKIKALRFIDDMQVEFNTWTNVDGKGKCVQPMALNTGIFVAAWKYIFRLGHWRNYEWTLKADPDTVLLPDRLKVFLTSRPLVPAENHSSEIVAGETSCGNCSKESRTMDTCEAHVKWVQQNWHTCAEALVIVAQPPPTDCGCFCGRDACRKPTSVFFKNCEATSEMHGPLEILSNGAVGDLEAGISDCEEKLQWSLGQFGEDYFLDHCLPLLGVTPLGGFEALADGNCWHECDEESTLWEKLAEKPKVCPTKVWPCDATKHASFHPLKQVHAYLKCAKLAKDSWHAP